MARSRRPSGWTWVYDPAGAFRRSKKPVPPDIQYKLQRRAQELIDTTLKPRYLQPPPQKAQFNYLVDISCKWRGPFFYFCSRYCSPGPRALSPFMFPSKIRLIPSLPSPSSLGRGREGRDLVLRVQNADQQSFFSPAQAGSSLLPDSDPPRRSMVLAGGDAARGRQHWRRPIRLEVDTRTFSSPINKSSQPTMPLDRQSHFTISLNSCSNFTRSSWSGSLTNSQE